MKDDHKHFDENIESDSSEDRSLNTPYKNTNFRISLQTSQNNQYFGEEVNNLPDTSSNIIPNPQKKNKSNKNKKNSKQVNLNENGNELLNNFKQEKRQNKNQEKKQNNENQEFSKSKELENKKNVLSKNIKQGNSQKYLEEISNSKFSIRTDLLQDKFSSSDSQKKPDSEIDNENSDDKNDMEEENIINQNISESSENLNYQTKKINTITKNNIHDEENDNLSNFNINNFENSQNGKVNSERKYSANNQNMQSFSYSKGNGSKNNNELKKFLSSMKHEISNLNSLLNKKRKMCEIEAKKNNNNNNSDNKFFYNDYDNFLIKFFHFNSSKNPTFQNDGIKSLSFGLGNNNLALEEQNSEFLNKSKINFFENPKNKENSKNYPSNLSNRKIIGLTPEIIYKIKKFQIDIKNIPKMSKFFESATFNNDEYFNSSIGKQQNFTNMEIFMNDLKFKKKPTLSYIERQNREALKLIEEKRQKFKHLPQSNKEKMDNNNLHKNWNWIVKKEIPKMSKIYLKYKNELEYNNKKLFLMVNKEIRKKASKVQRLQKEYNLRAKKLQKEMIIFWRKRDKEIIEIKKRKDKYEIEKKKREEELQESIMQKKRLEYLMKQSDIYSFFMHQKLGIAEGAENKSNNNENEDIEKASDENQIDNEQNLEKIQDEELEIEENPQKYSENGLKLTKIGDCEVAINPKTNRIIFQSIKVEIDEGAAKEGVRLMINKQREKVMKFDQQINRIRNTLGGDQVNLDGYQECQDEDFSLEGLDNPKLNNVASELLEQPKSFLGDLKEYQLKGLRWLDNLFEQGINGILADEMGLGKTIQAISLLAHLSEEKNNWGPFLVVAPNATLYNWQQEINKFCPTLKVLPYWGGLKERKTLRKFFTTNQLYTKSAAFHVCITSYQLVVSDDKTFNRVSWQYMILDEAQAIKNINSQRWNTLLAFNCRNRLLLSGTPIQNSMSELWALLHFIMPNLFDSHEQFQEWFSRDIEAHSQEKGELNQEQLKRLHKILKPFMLRRVKKDVENEIGPKTEYEILCDMTERQKILYNSIKEKLTNISDLFSSVDSKVKVENLMNLVMQFRKVCNHPELFERHIGKVPFVFRDLILSRTSTFIDKNSTAELRCDKSNLIKYSLPKLIYDECYEVKKDLEKFSIFKSKFSSLFEDDESRSYTRLFSFIGLFKFSKGDFLNLVNSNYLISFISLTHYLKELSQKNFYFKNYNKIFYENENNYQNDDERMENADDKDLNKYNNRESLDLFNFSCFNKFCLIRERKKIIKGDFNIFMNPLIYSHNEELNFFTRNYYLSNTNPLPPLIYTSAREMKDNLIYSEFYKHRIYIPKVISLPQDILCSSERLYRENSNQNNSLEMNKIFFGKNFKIYKTSTIKNIEKYFTFSNLSNSKKIFFKFLDEYLDKFLEDGIMSNLFYKYEGYTQIELPSFERLVSDCAKLKKLDELLNKLKKEDHRVLIFCQMTRMIDILEEYMAKRRYSYFRMDGSTNIADRRDMVNEFQTNPKIFAFLLSTRAGGLGVNLTGADTVIFYDNDWNPTMDAQATDRAHRIGQTKPVGVYRLTTKDTIEERILKRAKQKQNVQTTVYAGGAFKADIFKQSEIVELLYSEEEVKRLEAERKRITEINQKKSIVGMVVDSVENNEGGEAKAEEQENKSKSKKGGKNQLGKEKVKKNKEEIKVNKTENASVNLSRNIFAVSNTGGNVKKNIFNTSDDENNIIIQDGENPITLEEDEFEQDN